MLRPAPAAGLLAGIALLVCCSRTALQQTPPPELCAARCDDGVLCNGKETCDAESGLCIPGPPETCDDGDECTLDRCDVQSDSCVHRAQPRDRDADGWDACNGDCDDARASVFPGAQEGCNLVDDDCDGEVDEGLRSACGDCRPGCRLVYLPEAPPWSPTDADSDGVEDDANGALVLKSQSEQRFDAWIADDQGGRVMKIDTRSGAQLGLYDSVLSGNGNNAPPPNTTCRSDDRANCPSRTAVDARGAVYVANRAFDAQGTVTKIAGFLDDCVDRDGDGQLETSQDVNANGEIDREVDGEFLGQNDECILWTVDVGSVGSVPRAIVVTPDGHVWVGLHGESRVLELDPTDGRQLTSVPVPGFDPYGAAIDGERVWMVEALTGTILSVDTGSKRPSVAKVAPSPQAGCPQSYGITVDASGVVWIAGFSCPYAFGYDPAQDSWRSVHLPEGGVTRGIAADDRGRVYVAASHAELNFGQNQAGVYLNARPESGLSRLSVFDGATGDDIRTFGTDADPLPGHASIGVSLDHKRRAWLINQSDGTATLVDTDTGEVSHFAAGIRPYTYSDFTGFSLRKLYARSGEIRRVVEGCPMGPSEWERVTWDADMPAGSRVELRLRSAMTEMQLQGAPWNGPWDAEPADLMADPGPIGEGRFLEAEVRLFSGSSGGTPTLREVVFQVHCPL